MHGKVITRFFRSKCARWLLSKHISVCFLTLSLFLPRFVGAEEEVQYPWLDDFHQGMSSSVHDTANWFDSFFASESSELTDSARGKARIQLAWEPRSRDIIEFESRIRVNWKLPNLKNHVDVVFSDYDEELEKAPVKAAQNEQLADQNRFNLALRWIRKSDEKSVWSHRIGVGRKLQPFARSQYEHVFDLSDSHLLRTETSVYYYSSDGFGAHVGAQYEYGIDDTSVLRFDNNFYYRDDSKDWLWQHGAYSMSQLSEKSALICGFYIEGDSRPNYRVSEYLVSTRWRKSALRTWLYFELEPFVLWKREEDFKPSYGIALRVEGFFGH